MLEAIGEISSIGINNSDVAEKLLPLETGKAVIVIEKYSIGERQLIAKADLIKVLSGKELN